MHGWGLLQLLVIINYLVLFIEYAYQTLVVYPMLYRYYPISLLYSVILLLHCIVCVYITHCTHISVPARISKGQGAGPEKGLFSALLDFQKRHFLGTL